MERNSINGEQGLYNQDGPGEMKGRGRVLPRDKRVSGVRPLIQMDLVDGCEFWLSVLPVHAPIPSRPDFFNQPKRTMKEAPYLVIILWTHKAYAISNYLRLVTLTSGESRFQFN